MNVNEDFVQFMTTDLLGGEYQLTQFPVQKRKQWKCILTLFVPVLKHTLESSLP